MDFDFDGRNYRPFCILPLQGSFAKRERKRNLYGLEIWENWDLREKFYHQILKLYYKDQTLIYEPSKPAEFQRVNRPFFDIFLIFITKALFQI